MIITELCSGWKFWRNENGEGAFELISLPHDAMLGEPRSQDAVTGSAGAYFPGGVYRYELELNLTLAQVRKQLTLEFEGVYKTATVLVNGQQAMQHEYGYTGFYVPLKGLVHSGTNVIVVIADNTKQPNSRWYSGSGIYRPVRLIEQANNCIALNGVRITTLSLDPCRVHVDTAIEGTGTVEVELMLHNNVVATAVGASTDIVVSNPQPWSAETPTLYTCHVMLKNRGRISDELSIPFGIRTIAFGEQGLLINGVATKLKGGCVHHDNGILGAVDLFEASYRKIALLKSWGFNAIRSAHNPISKSMLAACDELGMYVMDEFADMWFAAKNPYDYALNFDECWQSDIKAMVEKDICHPSVIMYSIGNENAEPAEQKGVECAHKLAAYVRELDDTRPVTAGVNPMILFMGTLGVGVFNPEDDGSGAGGHNAMPGAEKAKESKNSSLIYNTLVTKVGAAMDSFSRLPQVGKAMSGFADALDIVGYNYGAGRYMADMKAHPWRPILGSETMPYDIAKNWARVEKYPLLVGDFMWTAIDYLGEVSLAGWSDDPTPVNKPYPWLCADTGALDLIGTANGEAAMAATVWDACDKPLIFVRPANLPNPVKAPWRGTNSYASWSWQGCEGNQTVVEVYTKAPIVKLYLNGRSVAVKRTRNCHADFSMTYKPGTLVALACTSNGTELARAELTSAASELVLALRPENKPKRGEIAFVGLTIEDGSNIVESNADCDVHLEVTGGELLAFGSAQQKSEHSYLEGCFPTRFGRALAVVKLPKRGKCTLAASAKGFAPATITI